MLGEKLLKLRKKYGYSQQALAAIDIMFSVKGILTDLDDEWIMLEVENKKKKTLKMFRIDNISTIKELV